jgi:hypothetical protein
LRRLHAGAARATTAYCDHGERWGRDRDTCGRKECLVNEFDDDAFKREQANFRTLALNEGMTGETVERLAKNPSRALACLEAAMHKGAGPGLAVHMFDAGDHPSKRERTTPRTNLHAAPSSCQICGGDRFVVVSTRVPQQSAWMKEHGIEPNEAELIEEYGPCPKCGQR